MGLPGKRMEDILIFFVAAAGFCQRSTLSLSEKKDFTFQSPQVIQHYYLNLFLLTAAPASLEAYVSPSPNHLVKTTSIEDL